MLEGRYTLIIPTYSRPDDLGRLLRFLARQQAAFRVLVLDSSRPEVQERNAAAARGLALDLRIERFEPATPPWEKFRRGAEMVQTEFSSMCADDDVVLLSALPELVGFLAANRDHGAAHGWYFNFGLDSAMDLTAVVYRGPSLDDPDPIMRLHRLFSRYEALTYAVHRTGVLAEATRRAAGMRNMALSELLGGAIAATLGKAARLPVLYYGRSLAPSQAYHGWHPVEFLIDSPAALIRDYAAYRGALFDAAAAHRALEGDPARLRQLVDLIHLRYLSEFYRPALVDHVIRCGRRGLDRAETLRGAWRYLDRTSRGLVTVLARSRLARRLRDRYLPRLRTHHLYRVVGRRSFETWRSSEGEREGRTYHVHRAFKEAVAELPGGTPATRELVRQLDTYA